MTIASAMTIANTVGAEAGKGSDGLVIPAVILLTVFVLAIYIGWEIITKVPPTLHTPLMSGSNAISGITIVGAIIATTVAGQANSSLAKWIGFAAIVCATINVVGGFLVTHRMLAMFKKKD